MLQHILEYSFIEDYNRLYQADQRTGALFNVFTVVAIFISCLRLWFWLPILHRLRQRDWNTKSIGSKRNQHNSVYWPKNS